MAVIADYTTLSDAVGGYLNRSDLSGYVPNFIRAAEQLVYRQVRNRGIETAFTGTTSSGVLALSGLTNFREMKWMRTSAQGGSLIEPMSIEELYRTYPDRTTTASFPRHFARDAAEIIFGPAAANGVALDGVYYSLLPALGASNTTNWFTANAPEVLLYGALLSAEPFIVGDARVPVWSTLFKESFEAVQEVERRERKTGTSRSIQVR